MHFKSWSDNAVTTKFSVNLFQVAAALFKVDIKIVYKSPTKYARVTPAYGDRCEREWRKFDVFSAKLLLIMMFFYSLKPWKDMPLCVTFYLLRCNVYFLRASHQHLATTESVREENSMFFREDFTNNDGILVDQTLNRHAVMRNILFGTMTRLTSLPSRLKCYALLN